MLLIVVMGLVAEQARADDTATRFELPCTETLEVVGYSRCTPYGTWGDEQLEPDAYIEYGVTWRHFTAARAAGVAPRAAQPAATAQAMDALVFAERLGVALSPRTYAGVEVELGSFELGSEAGGEVIIGGVGALGLHGQVAPLSLGAELAAGYRGYTHARGGDLIGEGVLEARARGRLWLSPWFTLGVVAGASLRERGDWMLGISVGFHSRAFGGDW